MELNKELLLKTLSKVEEEAAKPLDCSRWRQRDWRMGVSCGTAYCFAGWVVALGDGEDAASTIPGNTIRSRAMELLGFDEDENLSLFAASNTLDDLRYEVGLLLEGDTSGVYRSEFFNAD